MTRIAGALLFCLGALAAAIPVGASAQGTASTQQQGYLYHLTQQSAYDCATIQANLKELAATDYPDVSRAHAAMNITWHSLARELKGSELGDEDYDASAARLIARLPEGPISYASLAELAKPCEIMSNLHSEYFEMSVKQAQYFQDIFADRAALRNQAGGETLPAPVKDLVIDGWIFSARGNLCLAGYAFDDGAALTFMFSNYSDGSIKYSWDGLPELDFDDDNYDELVKRHSEGRTGARFSDYPGTAVFADGKFVAAMSAGMSNGHEYSFGHGFQGQYFGTLAGSQELSVKVLGKQTHTITFNGAELWNEMAECVAQYPFG